MTKCGALEPAGPRYSLLCGVDDTCVQCLNEDDCDRLESCVATDFAFIGFMLNDGDAYDLSAYDGLELKLESSDYVQVVLKTTGGGYFEYTLSPLSGSNLRYAPFAAIAKMANSAETLLNLATVYEVQFSVTDRTTFGLAIHSVTLY